MLFLSKILAELNAVKIATPNAMMQIKIPNPEENLGDIKDIKPMSIIIIAIENNPPRINIPIEVTINGSDINILFIMKFYSH